MKYIQLMSRAFFYKLILWEKYREKFEYRVCTTETNGRKLEHGEFYAMRALAKREK
jgi:hypothetical protein